MTYSWQFNTMRPSDKAREPIQGEFFSTDAISNPGEALVREGIQNSLDARRNGEKVMVRIRVSGTVAAVPRTAVDSFLNGLDEHLKAPGNGLREIPDDGENCSVLVFEDFGTTGLTGQSRRMEPDCRFAQPFLSLLPCRRPFRQRGKGYWPMGCREASFPESQSN